MSVRADSLLRVPALRHLIIVSLLGFASFCLTLASLPTWAVDGGSSRATAGLVTTTMLVATVATQGLVPAAINRVGIGPALSIGLVLLGAPAPLYALSSQLPLLLAVSAVRGLGFALLTVIGATLTSVVAPPERHGESVGLYGLAIALPNLVGIPGGVALTEAGDFGWVALLAASPLLALPWALRLGGEPTAPAEAAAKTVAVEGTATADAETHPALGWQSVVRVALAPSVVLLLITAAGGGLVTFLPIQRPHGAVASLALLVFSCASAIARWRAGVLIDRLGPRLLLPGSVFAAAAGMSGLGLCLVGGSSYDALLFVAAAVLGLGYGATQNLTLVIAFARAGRAGTAAASALWNAAFDAGTAAGAFLVGAIASGPGLPWSFVITGVAVLIVLPLALRLRTTGGTLAA